MATDTSTDTSAGAGTDTDTERLTARARELFAAEMATLAGNTQASRALFERARATMPLGVASSFQAADPYPIYLARGRGAEVWDVDGRSYFDFHNGFGSMAVGHAHPEVVAAIEQAARTGTHFAVTTETTVALAEELCPSVPPRTRPLHQLRYRGDHGRHPGGARLHREGRHLQDRGLLPRPSRRRHVLGHTGAGSGGDECRRRPHRSPAGLEGHPGRDGRSGRWPSPSTTCRRLERLFAERGDELACFIIEPVMMNIGIVLPQPGYLEGLRELCTRHGVVLIFDEVKCGATIAAGGAIERFGVQPDLACFAKSIAGGTPGGAFGGRADLMDDDRRRRRPTGDVQWQPAGGGGRIGRAHRGAHTRRLRALQAGSARAWPTGAAAPSPTSTSPRTSSTSGARAACRTAANRW